MYLSWIIPAYNEEKRIGKSLREVDKYLRSKNFAGGYEILVVVSASKDRTKEVVQSLETEVPSLNLLEVENKGKGWAVKQGMLRSRGDIKLFSDADNSTEPRYFDSMELKLKQGYDVVISSRHSRDASGAGRDVKEPWYREIMGGMGNMLIQIVGVWGIWDTQNGFKAFTKGAAERTFPRIRINGFSFDIEVLALARKFGMRIGIIPIQWRWEPESTVSLKAYFQVLKDLLIIRWNLFTKKYE